MVSSIENYYIFSIWPIDGTLSGTTTPESNSNEKVLQNSRSGALPSEDLVPYPGHSLGGGHTTTEMQSMYSTASVNWAELL